MLDFKDIKVIIKEQKDNYAKFEFTPLPRGYGHTLANSLRRIVLSSLPGAGITSIKFQDVDHEYSTVEGVKEDIVEIIMNFKDIEFKYNGDEPAVVYVEAKGKTKVTAGDLKLSAGVEVLNPDHHIATLTSDDAYLGGEAAVEHGVGYKELDEGERAEMGRIPVDADFSPIVKVSYDVENTRKGQDTDLDAVILEIETNGSITPEEALMSAAETLQGFAGQVMVSLGMPINEVEMRAEEAAEAPEKEELDEEEADNEILSWKVDDLPISKRSKSGLLSGGYEVVADIKGATTSDLLALSGFGNKSLNEVLDLLTQYGIELSTE